MEIPMQLFAEKDLTQPSAIADSTSTMIAALADLGCSKHVLAALLSMMDKVHPDHIRFLTGPVVQHRSSWAESTPQWLYGAAIADRVRIILEEHARRVTGWQVGPAELVAVMYPATMDAPMQMEYADIYLWAAAQANARHFGKSVAEVWSQVGEPVADRTILGPAGRYHHHYRQLCSDIRQRIIKAAGAAAHSSRTPAEVPAVVSKQLPLF
jgi:hypothetical protein